MNSDSNGLGTELLLILTSISYYFSELIPFIVGLFSILNLAMLFIGVNEAATSSDFSKSKSAAWALLIFFLQVWAVIAYVFATPNQGFKTRPWLNALAAVNTVLIIVILIGFLSIIFAP